MRKKPFVLLELLIGFALVSISILPFLRFPHLAMKKELELLHEMELEKAVQMELVNLQTEVMQKCELFSDEIEKWTVNKKKYTLVRSVALEKSKEGQDNMLYSLLDLKISVLQGKEQLLEKKSHLIAKKRCV